MKIFHQLDQLAPKELIPGFHGKFIHGKHVTIAYWEVKRGSILPEHHHVHEQVATVYEGEFELTVDGETQILEPGQPVVIPSNVPHSGRAITDCKITDVFSPVRPEYSSDQ